MPAPSAPDVTHLLAAWRAGDSTAFDRLLVLVYRELHRLAHRHMRAQPPGVTLQTTALLHEAYLRMLPERHMPWHNRAHFFAVCAQAMRCILVDAARARGAERRGGRAVRVPLDESRLASPDSDVDMLELDRALKRLAGIHPRKARVVELRYFGGLSVKESAQVLQVSPDTVMRDWSAAKLWLLHELRHPPEAIAGDVR